MKKNLIISTLLFAIATALGVNDPRDTRTIAIDIDTTLTTCCAEMGVNFEETFTVVGALENLLQMFECPAVLIGQAQVGSTGYTITTSGVHKLKENIRFSPVGAAAAITINADDVLLDLQCFTIAQANNIAAVDGISIAANHTNVAIHNGAIKNFTRDGIRVASGCSNLGYADIIMQSCLYGIFCLGTGVAPIKDMRAVGLDFLSNSTGVSLSFVQRAEFSECSSSGSLHAGFELISSFSNSIDTCSIEKTGAATGSAVGVSLISGGNNRVQNCYIDGVSTNDTFLGNRAVGILLGATENEDVIINNQISNCSATSNAQPFGIEEAYNFLSVPSVASIPANFASQTQWSPNGRYIALTDFDGLTTVEYANNQLKKLQTVSTVNVATWSPDGLYLATVSASSLVIYAFNEGLLTLVAQSVITVLGNISWSHDGKYLAVGGLSSSLVTIYSFDGSTLRPISQVTADAGIVQVKWSPTELNLAVISSVQSLRVYRFNPNSLQAVGVAAGSWSNLDWSADGRFIAVADGSAASVAVYRFTGVALTSVATAALATNPGRSVAWAPDGKTLAAVSGSNSVNWVLRTFAFNGTALTLLFNVPLSGPVAMGFSPQGLDWSPLGTVLALGVSENSLVVYSTYSFGQNNVISYNQISNIFGPALPASQPGVSSGRGLSASSANNLIVNNTVFDADLSYVFVNNIFEQFIVNAAPRPNLLSNVSFPPL